MKTLHGVSLAPLIALAVLSAATGARGQSLTLPPSGDNQKASASQHIGPVVVSVSYSSPRVHAGGQDRSGKIWGELVPYGLSDLGFNDCKACPWRAGANENTVFTVSHDVKVEGKPLPAGSYGLHMIPGKESFTVIFSKNAGSWGSYWYDPKEDALRVDVKPAKAEFHEWLSYEFTEREPSRATLAMHWENLKVPLSIAVDDVDELYFQAVRREMRGQQGFRVENLVAAAQFTLQTGKHLEEGLAWAQRAVTAEYMGQENFQTLSTLGRLQLALGKAVEAEKSFDKAIAGSFPNHWPVNVGLARGYAANGDLKKALEHAKLALAQAPDELNRKALAGMIAQLEKGQAPK
jgi:hypothetical protein